jgi:hypothetical protein
LGEKRYLESQNVIFTVIEIDIIMR